ncbi:NUDIX hydrolase [Planococcus halotolerans]|uniref:NUDIX hydrolase n=1 Tax=Planococcus halotolerans TaxID=2233542 RepID=A0A365L7V7_9BACL|nr:NUDIX hydrolase [Planococcus halotolerans]RAZ81337.1 NUDIX hydrolase [Planococcus halotolerans]
MKAWYTTNSEYLYKTPFGNLRKDKCKLPNGITIEDYYVNEYVDWVNAVVLTKDNQIVLVEQYRHGGQGFYLEIPAGKKEEGETDEEGILREIQEETGYTSMEKPILLGEFMVNPATQNNKIKTFLLTNAYKSVEQHLDETEEIEVKLIGFEKFGHLIRNQEIQTQLFTASAYYMAKAVLDKR